MYRKWPSYFISHGKPLGRREGSSCGVCVAIICFEKRETFYGGGRKLTAQKIWEKAETRQKNTVAQEGDELLSRAGERRTNTKGLTKQTICFPWDTVNYPVDDNVI